MVSRLVSERLQSCTSICNRSLGEFACVVYPSIRVQIIYVRVVVIHPTQEVGVTF